MFIRFSSFLLLTLVAATALAQPNPQAADQIFNTPAGNHIRIVGAPVPDGAVVLPSPIGDAINIPSVPPTAECNVILDAKPITRADFYGDPDRGMELIPNIPELGDAFGVASWPVPIPGSDDGQGSIMWNALFKGARCVTAGDSAAYVVSSMAELVPLVASPPWKCRLLRATIQVEIEIDGQMTTGGIEVSSCDPRVIPAQHRIYIGHSWAGRWQRLNFRGFSNGALEDRGKPGKVK